MPENRNASSENIRYPHIRSPQEVPPTEGNDLYNRNTNIQSSEYHDEKDRKARKDILNIVLTTLVVLLIFTAVASLIAKGLITYFFLWVIQLFRG